MNYTYDPYGKVLTTTGTLAATLGTYNPLRYRGYVYDHETGLYYLQSRYYDPAIGRFLNADAFASTGQGILGNNMFAYCRNNPISRIDISGSADTAIEEEYDDDVEVTPVIPGAGGGAGGGGGSNGGSGIVVGTAGGGGSTYTPPQGGGGVSSSVQVGDITVTFGHGGNHMGGSDVSTIESFIANDVVTRPASPTHVTHVLVSYHGNILNYGYFTRSDTLINVGTYFFVPVALTGE